MRIIDKTSLQDEAGNINIIARVQGTLKYGLSWYSELEAQKLVVTQLDRLIEKSFVLIRNFTLPNSEIVIPIILLGPASLSVILVTPVKGHFEAKGREWNVISNKTTAPASRNLVDLLAKLTRAFEKHLENQNIRFEVPIESVLIASDPGAQIDSSRPAVRIVRSDAIKQFANSLLQERPIIRPDAVYALADKILDPKSKTNEIPIASELDERPVSRAQAIFNASANDASQNSIPQNLIESNPAQPLPRPRQQKSRGMNQSQTLLLVVMGLIECCVIAAGSYVLFFLS